MVVKIFTNPTNYDLDKLYHAEKDSVLIGVEKGAYYALKHGLELDLAIGDFDSVTEAEKAYIDQKVLLIKNVEKEKNETDLFLAIQEALQYNPDEILIYGGLGERIDHTFANITYLKLGNITLINNTHVIFMLDPGYYKVENQHKYVSFFAIEDVKKLSLTGFKYTLDNYDLNMDDTVCVSNEGHGTVQFKSGLLLVVQSNL